MNYRVFKYLLPFGVYLATWRSFHGHGWIVFLPLMYAFFLVPLLELVFSPDARNMTEAEEAIAKNDRLYDWFLYLIVPFQYLALYWFLTGITDQSLLWWEKLGRILSMGLACGTFGINVGHELGHRVKPYEQWLAKSLLLTSLYTHFFIEHNKGHHKNVSTPIDPSSAPKGMTLYRFWLRSVSGTWRDAWLIAKEDLQKKGLPALHFKNEMLQLQMLQVIFLLLIIFKFGWAACGYFVVAAILGFLLLETVNYIEHYGLARKETAPGKYERALPQHSWNSNHVLGRLMLFELSRHSDHHYLASRKYQVLRHHDEAPQLPTGYPGSILLATVPPLWFAVMDKRLREMKVE
jgi:alkane 1-monooxygenase